MQSHQQAKEEKSHDHINRHRKNISKKGNKRYTDCEGRHETLFTDDMIIF